MNSKMYNNGLPQKKAGKQQIRKRRKQRLVEKLVWLEMAYGNTR